MRSCPTFSSFRSTKRFLLLLLLAAFGKWSGSTNENTDTLTRSACRIRVPRVCHCEAHLHKANCVMLCHTGPGGSMPGTEILKAWGLVVFSFTSVAPKPQTFVGVTCSKVLTHVPSALPDSLPNARNPWVRRDPSTVLVAARPTVSYL